MVLGHENEFQNMLHAMVCVFCICIIVDSTIRLIIASKIMILQGPRAMLRYLDNAYNPFLKDWLNPQADTHPQSIIRLCFIAVFFLFFGCLIIRDKFRKAVLSTPKPSPEPVDFIPSTSAGAQATLVKAVSENDRFTVLRLLTDTNVNTCAHGEPLVLIALKKHHFPMVQLLLYYGADIKPVLDWVHKKEAAAVLNPQGQAPLLLQAVDMQSPYVIALLLRCGADRYLTPDQWLAVKRNMSDPPLSFKLAERDVPRLLAQRSALHEAARSGNTVQLKQLLHQHIPVDTVDDAGNTALHHAASQQQSRVVVLLLQHRANTEYVNHQGDSAILIAARSNNVPVTLTLLSADANIYRRNLAGERAYDIIQASAQLGNHALIQTLLQGHDGLFAAVQCDKNPLPAVAACLTQGTSPNIRNELGCTPLALASAVGRVEIVKHLVADHRTDIHARTYDDQTPLMLACRGGHTEVVGVLLAARVATDSINNEGESALMIAAKHGHNNIVTQLLQAHSAVDQKLYCRPDFEPINRWMLKFKTKCPSSSYQSRSVHQAIAAITTEGNRISRLNLSESNITDIGIYHSVKALPQTSLHTLDLSWNKLTSVDIQRLAGVLPLLPSLQVLNLSVNSITDTGARCLASVLPLTSLQVIDLYSNKITCTGARYLIGASLYAPLNTLILKEYSIKMTSAPYFPTRPYLRGEPSTIFTVKQAFGLSLIHMRHALHPKYKRLSSQDVLDSLCRKSPPSYPDILCHLLQYGIPVTDAVLKQARDFHHRELLRLITSSGTTALMLAAMRGQADVVATLLQHGADKHQQHTVTYRAKPSVNLSAFCNRRYRTSRHFFQGMNLNSSIQNNMRIQTESWVPLLAFDHAVGEAKTIVANICGYNNLEVRMTPLMHAAQKQHSDVIDLLLDEETSTQTDGQGWDALCYAVDTGNHDTISQILPYHGGSWDLTRPTHRMALHIAIIRGHEPVVAAILANYEPQKLLTMMEETVERNTPLLVPTIALIAEQTSMLSFLIDYYKTAHSHILKQTCIIAFTEGIAKMIPIIIQLSIRHQIRLDHYLSSIIEYAIKRRHLPMLALLIQYGTNILSIDQMRNTIVAIALHKQHYSMLQLVAFSQTMSEGRNRPLLACDSTIPAKKAMLERVQHSQTPSDLLYRAILFENLEQQSFDNHYWEVLHLIFIPSMLGRLSEGPMANIGPDATMLVVSYLLSESLFTRADKVIEEKLQLQEQQLLPQGHAADDMEAAGGAKPTC